MRLSKIIPYIRPLHHFCVEYSDRMAGENNGDMKTNGELYFLKRHISQCAVVFDVGANIGEWTELVLNLNSFAEVHCFEPQKNMFMQLTKKNFPNNVHANQIGLSNEKGIKDIYLDVQSFYARTGLKAGWGITSPGKTEVIQVTTIDEYCREKNITQIDFLKCDVEGHEYAVIQGAERMLREERIKRIQFEYGGCNIDARVMLKDYFELFSGRGYTFYKLMPKQMIRFDEYDMRLENFNYKNFAILHNSVKA